MTHDGQLRAGLERERRRQQAADAKACDRGERAGQNRYGSKEYLEQRGALLRRCLVELHRVPVRIVEQDLLATGPGFHRVAEMRARLRIDDPLERFDRRSEVWRIVVNVVATTGIEPAAGTELWQVSTDGGTIELRLQYQRGIAMRSKSESRPRSAVDPAISRIYRVDQGLDLIRSVPLGIDRVQTYSLRVTLPELRAIFDGNEQVVSIALYPWYLRQEQELFHR